ncbi:hypothetical protein [Streptomyces canus]|uniref:hypothetical protein n=1 Tax=Streptomyces canus TaxID=58343 RepID=UPI002254FFF9|nr:hypothetical protein [Streptomyces canus]MCX4854884.1 hypothetical protein [Streptomyces canus]
MSNWHRWAAVAAFGGAYVLIISERVHRTAAALGGAGAMLAGRFRAVLTGVLVGSGVAGTVWGCGRMVCWAWPDDACGRGARSGKKPTCGGVGNTG